MINPLVTWYICRPIEWPNRSRGRNDCPTIRPYHKYHQSTIRQLDHTTIWLSYLSTIRPQHHSTIRWSDDSTIQPMDYPTIRWFDNTTNGLSDNSTMPPYLTTRFDDSTILPFDNSKIRPAPFDDSIMRRFDNSTIYHRSTIDDSTIPLVDDSIIWPHEHSTIWRIDHTEH